MESNIRKIAAAVLVGLAARMLAKESDDIFRSVCVPSGFGATYGDAARAVMGSSILSSFKTQILQVLKRNEASDYYEAVIAIMKSDMLGSSMLNAIKDLK